MLRREQDHTCDYDKGFADEFGAERRELVLDSESGMNECLFIAREPVIIPVVVVWWRREDRTQDIPRKQDN